MLIETGRNQQSLLIGAWPKGMAIGKRGLPWCASPSSTGHGLQNVLQMDSAHENAGVSRRRKATDHRYGVETTRATYRP